MELLKNFGFDPILFSAQIVNFLVILFILRKFMYKPVIELLKKREVSIKEGVQKAEEGKLALEKALIEEKKILKKAQAEATLLLQEAKEEARSILMASEENAKKNTTLLLNEARLQIAEEAKTAEERIVRNIGSLAVQFLKKSLENIFTEENQNELITRAIKQLKAKPN